MNMKKSSLVITILVSVALLALSVYLIIIDCKIEVASLPFFASIIGAARVVKDRKLARRLAEQRRQDEEISAKRFKEQQIKEESFAAGAWEFPSRKFFDELTSANVSSLETEFSVSKAKIIAESLIKAAGIPTASYSERFAEYTSADRLKEYFADGKRLYDEEVKMKAEAERKRLITPVKVELSELQYRSLGLAACVAGLSGLDKRREYLKYKISDYENSISKLKGLATSDAYLKIAQSTAQERTHNWGIVGGIASGIAGPAAGMIAASEVMQENQRIEQRNAAAKEANLYLAKAALDASIAAKERIERLNNSVARIRKELDELNTKVVMSSVSFDELRCGVSFVMLIFKSHDLEAKPYVSMDITVRNSFQPQSDADKLVVDGIIAVKVSCKGVLLETVDVPLPYYGIRCGESAVCSIPLELALPEARTIDYHAECSFKSLWLMER